MKPKYWVPALQKANEILQLIAGEPNRLKLIDLSRRLQINKSSMFSLLQTMETLDWVVRDNADTYALGTMLGQWGSAYFRQFDIIRSFHLEAAQLIATLGETIQLAKLDGTEVFYLARLDAPTPVRLTSEPGMKFPAHATALGKVMLAQLSIEEWMKLYQSDSLGSLTPQTVTSRSELLQQLKQIKENGFALDLEESVTGFCCVAAPVITSPHQPYTAVSCSMPAHLWELKREQATREICRLAARLSWESVRRNQ